MVVVVVARAALEARARTPFNRGLWLGMVLVVAWLEFDMLLLVAAVEVGYVNIWGPTAGFPIS